jgi:hypothetical protein
MNLAADRGRRLQRQTRALLRGGAVLMIDLRERLQELADAAHPRGRHARPRPRHPPRPLARLDLHRDLSGAGFVITQMHRDLASVAEPCAGGSRRAELVGYVRSQQYSRLVMVVAVPPEPDETSVCWTAEMFELGGAGRWTCR